MLLSIYSQPSRRKSFPKRTLHLRCDVCNREYEKPYYTHIETALHHACSRTCQSRAQHVGGALDEKKRQVMLERHGVENPQQSADVRQKTRQTNLRRYGHEVSSKSDQVKERARQTNQEKFGVDWHTQSKNFVDKSKLTWEERYGVDHPMKSSEVKAKYDFTASWRKAHETKKRNGTYASSQVERWFHERIVRLFENVETQVRVEHETGVWLIDFQVRSTYVQLDGIYWHGLDRPIDVIRASEKPRDKAIVRAYDHDRQQDAWFKAHGLKLVRVTDRQAKMMSDDDILLLLT